jgi:hypothetical protein
MDEGNDEFNLGEPYVSLRNRLEMRDTVNLMSSEECAATVNMLKKGPADIPSEISISKATGK